MTKKTFTNFEISAVFCEALAQNGIINPFPIQESTLPISLAGKDLIGQAKTGTGKTLGFILPILELIKEKYGDNGSDKVGRTPLALVVLPTRELAKQVAKELKQTAGCYPVSTAEIYGGVDLKPQIKTLAQGVDIVVGTPGRLLDLQGNHHLNLGQVQILVLDEADEMLDLGFLPDVEKLVNLVPKNRQTMLFSATIPTEVINLAKRYMNKPTRINVRTPDDESVTAENVKQLIYRTHALNKMEVVARILQARDRELAIIFTRTKRNADKIMQELSERGFAVAAMHGNLGQNHREQALGAFRKQKIDILVATDVAARGIDIEQVTHVINYECPDDAKSYIHRIGRTARAGAQGTAITFVDWDEMSKWHLIRIGLKQTTVDPVETYHTSEHLYRDLNIPNDITGILPKAKRTRAGLAAEKLGKARNSKCRQSKHNNTRNSQHSCHRGNHAGEKSQDTSGRDSSSSQRRNKSKQPKRNRTRVHRRKSTE